MYLFGGKETNSSNVLNQIWRGRINRLGFLSIKKVRGGPYNFMSDSALEKKV